MNYIHNEEKTEVRADACRDFTDALERLFAFAATLGDTMQTGLDERALTRARATVVWLLHRRSAITQRQLAETLRVTPRNVTGLIDALQAAGFVARTPHPTDRRATLVALTDAGRATAEKMAAGYRATAAHLFADLPQAQLAQFLATLDLLTARVQNMSSTTRAPGATAEAPPAPSRRRPR